MLEKRENESEKVTDLDYLLKLSKGNNTFVKDMIRIFLEENPSEISTLEKAVEERDFKLINAAAHKLRSTVPFVGIDKMISGEIAELEQLALDQAGGDNYGGAVEKKPGFLPNDKEVLSKIESLFSRIKLICFRAYDELRAYN